MKTENIRCILFGKEGFEKEILWRPCAEYLRDALTAAGFKTIVVTAEPEGRGRGDFTLALRSDAVPEDMAALTRLTDGFEGGEISLRLPDGEEIGSITGGFSETPARRETLPCVRGFLADADAYERFALTQRINRDNLTRLMQNGVRFLSTDGVLICPDAVIGDGCEILPGVVIKGGVRLGKGCVVGPDTLIEDSEAGDGCVINSSQVYSSRIGSNVRIGPFSHIRPNCEVRDGVKIGDFVELKNSVIGENTSVAHLTYVGDSDVGSRVNFGCGCVTVNYDGRVKSRTVIGDNVFIGCNTNLVAPVTVEDGSYIAAGSTITDTVPEDSLAIARARQVVKDGWAKRRREKKPRL